MIALSPAQQSYWDWRAASNFLGGGAGSGLLIASVVDALLVGGDFRIAALIALGLIGWGLFSVWMEIGRPFRFLNVFRNPKTSWMSREAYAALPLFAFGLASVAFASIWLLVLAAGLAAVFLYCQARILFASKGIVAWREAAIVPLIVATGLAEGSALLVAIAALSGAPVLLPAVLTIAFAVARSAAFQTYRHRLEGQSLPAQLRAALGGLAGLTRSLGLAGAGASIVVGVVFYPALAGTALLIAGALAALAAGWLLKFRLVCRFAHVQGIAIAHTPARGGGAAGPAIKPGWTRKPGTIP